MLDSPELRDALREVDATFEPHLEKLEHLCMYCDFSKRDEPETAAWFARFEAVIRAHRRERLALPIRAIWDESAGHGSALVQGSIRRLAWFVPAVLAESLTGGFADTMRRLAGLALDGIHGERAYHELSPRDFLAAERNSLETFLCAAIRAIPAGDVVGVDDLASTFLVAMACGCDSARLMQTLQGRPDAASFLAATIAKLSLLQGNWQHAERDALAATSGGVTPSSEEALQVLYDRVFVEETRRFLEERFLAEQDEARARIISGAEKTVAERIGVRGR